jgi:hypothetical protein
LEYCRRISYLIGNHVDKEWLNSPD